MSKNPETASAKELAIMNHCRDLGPRKVLSVLDGGDVVEVDRGVRQWCERVGITELTEDQIRDVADALSGLVARAKHTLEFQKTPEGIAAGWNGQIQTERDNTAAQLIHIFSRVSVPTETPLA